MTISPISCDLMKIKIKGFKVFKDRHGKLRCYHRASGTSIDFSEYQYGSIEFLGECGRIAALSKPDGKPKPGSLGLLVKEFKASLQWKELKPKTQEWYEMGFQYLRPINDTPLLRFNAPLIVKIRDKALSKKGWYFANLLKTTLSMAFSWGVERGYMDNNPAKQVKKIKRPKNKPRANRPWTDKERFIVLDNSDNHVKPLISAMMYTGMDPCDAVGMQKTKYKDGAFDFNRQKTGNPIWKPAPAELKRIMANMPKHDAITLFANSYGKPWTKSGFDSVWAKLRKSLEDRGLIAKGLTLKGLRHTHATHHREMGGSDGDVADAIGDKSESMGRHYSRDADMKNKQKKNVISFNRMESEKRRKFVKPSGKSVKP